MAGAQALDRVDAVFDCLVLALQLGRLTVQVSISRPQINLSNALLNAQQPEQSHPREPAHLQQTLAVRYAELVYNGVWFSTQRQALDGFFNVSQQRVTGSVGLKLWKGTLNVTSRKSPFSLYRADLASFTMGRYNPKDAEGFINLFALPVTVRPKAKAEGSNS